ncbi:MAG: hypothetical protein JSS27_02035 [Planctomycetes bacterium]|nr:hypothetical protein [Planctomycetota bacterium]
MKTKSGLLLVVGAALFLAASASVAFPPDKPAAATSELSLRVEEAQAYVRLYEIRLLNAKVIAEQEGLKWDNVNATFAQLERAFEKGAISDKSFREGKEQFEWYRLQDKIQDWQEIEEELNIAKIRLRMVERGMVVYGGDKP